MFYCLQDLSVKELENTINCEIRMSEGYFAIISSIYPLLKNFVSVGRISAVLLCGLAAVHFGDLLGSWF